MGLNPTILFPLKKLKTTLKDHFSLTFGRSLIIHSTPTFVFSPFYTPMKKAISPTLPQSHSKRTLRTLMVFTFALLVHISHSQDLISTMKSLNAKMAEATNLHIKTSIKVFNTETNKVILTNEAEIKRKPSAFYKNLGNLEILSTSDFYVTANHQTNIITFSPNGVPEQNQLSMEELLPSADSLLNLYLSYEYLGLNADIKTYKITPKVAWLKTMVIQMDEADNLVKIHYDYDESVYGMPYGVDVTYNVFDLNARFTANDFSKNKFVTLKDDFLQPSNKYSNFRIVDDN